MPETNPLAPPKPPTPPQAPQTPAIPGGVSGGGGLRQQLGGTAQGLRAPAQQAIQGAQQKVQNRTQGLWQQAQQLQNVGQEAFQNLGQRAVQATGRRAEGAIAAGTQALRGSSATGNLAATAAGYLTPGMEESGGVAGTMARGIHRGMGGEDWLAPRRQAVTDRDNETFLGMPKHMTNRGAMLDSAGRGAGGLVNSMGGAATRRAQDMLRPAADSLRGTARDLLGRVPGTEANPMAPGRRDLGGQTPGTEANPTEPGQRTLPGQMTVDAFGERQAGLSLLSFLKLAQLNKQADPATVKALMQDATQTGSLSGGNYGQLMGLHPGGVETLKGQGVRMQPPVDVTGQPVSYGRSTPARTTQLDPGRTQLQPQRGQTQMRMPALSSAGPEDFNLWLPPTHPSQVPPPLPRSSAPPARPAPRPTPTPQPQQAQATRSRSLLGRRVGAGAGLAGLGLLGYGLFGG